MACDQYKERLTDLALGAPDTVMGEREAAEVRAHVAACDACRAVLEREQTLFAAMDAGLDTAVNAVPSPEYVARIRQRVAQETAQEAERKSSWLTGWIPVTVAGVAAVTLLAVWLVPQWMQRPSPSPVPPPTTAQSKPPEATVTPSAPTSAQQQATPPTIAAVPPRVAPPPNPRRRAPVEAARAAQPEIIVAAGQMDAIRAFYRAAHSPRVEAETLLAAAGPVEPPVPLAVTRLQVPSLQVKRLGPAEPDSDSK